MAALAIMLWQNSVSRQTPDVTVPGAGRRPVRSCTRRPPLPPGASRQPWALRDHRRPLAACQPGTSPGSEATTWPSVSHSPHPYLVPLSRIPFSHPVSRSPYPASRSRSPRSRTRQRRPAAALSRGRQRPPRRAGGLPQAAPPSWRGPECSFLAHPCRVQGLFCAEVLVLCCEMASVFVRTECWVLVRCHRPWILCSPTTDSASESQMEEFSNMHGEFAF
ncbi:uncharacterized protein LOC130258028 [Oenanthe melanoleuca]|uniref:uncharacterized protein LOC130258028 n=1 Tax=Oenanthe melanoleuca TaxID=2939378 RepID=UPI0024C0F754|nr:uncharacterized protein LOC130258028 [Oenanthe melanoleuca]